MGIEETGQKALVEGAQALVKAGRRAVAGAKSLLEQGVEQVVTRGDGLVLQGVRRQGIARWRSGDAAVEALRRFNARIIRERPDLARLKFKILAEDVPTLLRGANGLLGLDLAEQPRVPVQVWLQGDAHLLNLGTYKPGGGDPAVSFNDFDDAVRGPFDWDLRHMAASVEATLRQAGATDKQAAEGVDNFLQAYRKHLQKLHKQGPKALEVLPEPQSRLARNLLKQAEERDRTALLDRWTDVDAHGKRKFKSLPGELLPVSVAERNALADALREYLKSVPPELRRDPAFYKIQDVAGRISGVGSLGNHNFYVLVQGKEPGLDHQFILQFKEQPGAAYGGVLHSPVGDEGKRVATAQQLLQPGADRYLGHVNSGGRSYYVRNIQPARLGLKAEDLTDVHEIKELAADAGAITAHAHARGGNAGSILAYLEGKGAGLMDDIAGFARKQTDQLGTYLKALRTARKQDPLLGKH